MQSCVEGDSINIRHERRNGHGDHQDLEQQLVDDTVLFHVGFKLVTLGTEECGVMTTWTTTTIVQSIFFTPNYSIILQSSLFFKIQK